jgi:hypothetical protein
LQRFGNQEFLLVFAHNKNRLSPFFKLKRSYGFPDTAGSANNQTGLADKFRRTFPSVLPLL